MNAEGKIIEYMRERDALMDQIAAKRAVPIERVRHELMARSGYSASDTEGVLTILREMLAEEPTEDDGPF